MFRKRPAASGGKPDDNLRVAEVNSGRPPPRPCPRRFFL